MKIKELKQHQFLNTCIVEFETDDMSVLNVFPAGHYIDKGLCRVMEQNDEQVGNVFIINESDDFLLFTDMDILVGAKQNRVVNVSTLVKPRSKSNLEVSCVEQNRWDHSHLDFKNSKQSIEPNMRRKKFDLISEKPETGQYRDELQSEIWSDVRHCLMASEDVNSTADYNSYLEAEKARKLSKEIPVILPDMNCNGVAIFVDDKLINVELFANTALYQYYFNKIADHYQNSAKSKLKSSKKISDNDMKISIEKEIGMCLFFNSVNAKNGVGELRFMDTDIRKGFELSYGGEKVHEVIFLGK